ncbi:HD domain-containing protein [Anaerostipes hadrus]|uniref:HD domain-containing protein n=1 Tax=Anaerostipes hadrus TaxID=649756 RepID=UPI00156E6A21|nr:HD domain-containing protein [Anaerostipes hadrus]NSH53759.1 HD domain-containing protein [Anaerostipes hadrus]
MDINKVTTAMIDYYQGQPKRIQHFLKVHAYAKLIGEQEGLDKEILDILEVAVLTHDIGIKISEEKYNSSAGKYQEVEGPAVAQQMLEDLQYDKAKTDRVCYLIGHHHTYDQIDGIDYQILVEADFLVNLAEEQSSRETIESVKGKIFKTKTGIWLINKIF